MDITHDPRAALEIKRYHTWRVNNQQSVGEHTAQVLRIMLTVWPNCPRHVIVHAVTHDMGEMAGDIPYPFKARVPGLKEKMDDAEAMVRQNMKDEFGMPPPVELSSFERRFFKACENLEMLEAGLVEVNMGNRYAELIVGRMRAAVKSIDLSESPMVEWGFNNYYENRIKKEKM